MKNQKGIVITSMVITFTLASLLFLAIAHRGAHFTQKNSDTTAEYMVNGGDMMHP